MYELKTWTEIYNFRDNNNRIGFVDNACTQFQDYGINNIWLCELYQNKKTSKFALLITIDSDESVIVVEF
jgi:hypothetical protein